MPEVLDSLWTMLTAGDLLGFVGGLIMLILAILLAPFVFVAGLVGIK